MAPTICPSVYFYHLFNVICFYLSLQLMEVGQPGKTGVSAAWPVAQLEQGKTINDLEDIKLG